MSQINLEKYPYHIHDVHISDPFILADPETGHYFTYVQFVDTKRFPDVEMKRGTFYVLESEDLVHWTKPAICFHDDNFWADSDFWAPEVHIWNGKYYLISSFRAKGSFRRCQALVSDHASGPFVVGDGEPLTPDGWHCLDGTLYCDKKGDPWLVFCHEWLQVYDGQVCAVRVNHELTKAVGEPMILFHASDGPWAGPLEQGGNVTDGPFLHRMQDGTLIMLWSSFTARGAYAISYATSASGEITGPWIQQQDPLYALDGGHGMLFRTFDGRLFMSCHCPNDHPKKRILLFEMQEDKNKLHIVNEMTGNWYQHAGGEAKGWVYPDPCKEETRILP